MSRIAVTGSAGFLGSHLVDALLRKGCEVAGIDNLSMGSRDNFRHLKGCEQFHFHETDVRDVTALRDACRGADTIVHLAAFKIPRYGGAVDTLLVNARGAEHVLEIAREQHSKVIMASTSDVYGKNPALPFHEGSDSVLGSSTVPRWSYAVSKLYEEHLAFAYQAAYGVPVVLLRFFGSYGPREHRSWWGGPQATFIEAALDGRELEIHGDGAQTRSFTYVSDTVDGIVRAIEQPAAVGQVLNIGSQAEISIIDLATLVYRLIGGAGEPPLQFVPYAKLSSASYEDVRRRVPDVTKSQEMLGLQCRVPLEEGLRRTIEWHRAQRSYPAAVATGMDQGEARG